MIFGTGPPKAIEQFNQYSIDRPTDSNDGICKKSHGWGWIPKKGNWIIEEAKPILGFIYKKSSKSIILV